MKPKVRRQSSEDHLGPQGWELQVSTFRFILSDDCDCLTRILQGNGSLLVAGIAEVNPVDLQGGGEAEMLEMKTRLQPTQAPAQEPWVLP